MQIPNDHWFHSSNDSKRKRTERMMMEEAEAKREEKAKLKEIARLKDLVNPFTGKIDTMPEEKRKTWADKFKAPSKAS